MMCMSVFIMGREGLLEREGKREGLDRWVDAWKANSSLNEVQGRYFRKGVSNVGKIR